MHIVVIFGCQTWEEYGTCWLCRSDLFIYFGVDIATYIGAIESAHIRPIDSVHIGPMREACIGSIGSDNSTAIGGVYGAAI